MSHGSYEYESSGGLMPMIRALVKPPDELMNPPKPKKPQHPYYKRPGKGHNRDCCDACSEGGDLICCDRCPASFHLGCYDPPLEEEDIPIGLWLCKACRASDAASGEDSNTPSGVETEKRTRNRGNSSTKKKGEAKKEETKKEEAKRDESKKEVAKKDESKKEPTKEDTNTDDKMDVDHQRPGGAEDLKNDSDKELSPMDLLVKAAKVMNPKQFDIPREMKIPVTFPGTEKDKRSNPRQSSVDAWGNNIPPPAKECFVCRGNSKRAPLLQCDYCPLLFHQDCLNPPLTALPIGRWMCPNHVEQYIDWNMVNSISVTERVALWDKFAGPIDQHAIKVDFLRRARRNNPAFRVKVPAPERGRVVVPPMVQQHYNNPPPLLPSRREFVRCANVLRNLKATGAYDESEEDSDMDENSKHKICMNMSCPRYTGEGPCPLDTTKLHGASKEEAEHDLKSITEPKEIKERPVDPSTSDNSDSDFEQQIHTTVKRRKAFTADNTSPRHPQRREPLILREDEDVEELIATADDQLKHLDEKLVKILAWQRMQQIAAGEQIAGGWRRASGTTKWADRSAAAIRAPERARLQRLGVNLQPLPSELLEREDRDRISEIVWGERPATPPPSRTPSPRSELKDAFIIASLVRVSTPLGSCSIAKLDKPIPMRSNSLRVGSQSCCDVVLDGKCRRVSPMHAIIFRDQVTNYFEMLNYSEWGSQVNGVMYACDLTPRATEPPHSAAAAADARASVLRNLVGRHMPRQARTEGPITDEREDPCTCPKKPPNTVGAWEGSALLPHGALLQFGCYRFVFSITDAVAFPYESKNKKPSL